MKEGKEEQIKIENNIIQFIFDNLSPLSLGFEVKKKNAKEVAINCLLLIITKKGKYWAGINIPKDYLMTNHFRKDLLDGNFIEQIRDHPGSYALHSIDGFRRT